MDAAASVGASAGAGAGADGSSVLAATTPGPKGKRADEPDEDRRQAVTADLLQYAEQANTVLSRRVLHQSGGDVQDQPTRHRNFVEALRFAEVRWSSNLRNKRVSKVWVEARRLDIYLV